MNNGILREKQMNNENSAKKSMGEQKDNQKLQEYILFS